MTERFANLCQALRATLTEIARELGVPKGQPLVRWLDTILEDDGIILNIIEDFASSSYIVGKYEGNVEGWEAARAAILASAGKAFADGYDDHATSLRRLARDLQPHIDKAKEATARERKDRGH